MFETSREDAKKRTHARVMWIYQRATEHSGPQLDQSHTVIFEGNESEAHYENMSIDYTAIFHGCKNDNFQMIFFFFFNFAQNIDCGYTLEPPQRGGSNEYPQSMFWSKNKKNMNTRVNPTFSI